MNEKPGMSDSRQELATKIGTWLGLAAFAWLMLILVIMATVAFFRWLV